MVEWHHQLNGHESEQTPGDSEGQGGLTFCNPWGCKRSDRNEGLNKESPTLCDPMDCSLPVSSDHGTLQARILEWVAFPFSRESSQPRDQTLVLALQADLYHLSLHEIPHAQYQRSGVLWLIYGTCIKEDLPIYILCFMVLNDFRATLKWNLNSSMVKQYYQKMLQNSYYLVTEGKHTQDAERLLLEVQAVSQS